MNIFIREIKAHRKSLVIWCVGVLFMIASGMGKYAGYSASGQSINELLAQMPKSLQAIMGVGSLDLSKASGYYGILFLYLALMAAIHASMLGVEIISKEERDKTSEFLMVKPISRNKIITSKLFAALFNIAIINITTLVGSIMMVGYYSKGEEVNEDIVIVMGGMFFLQLIFLMIGAAIAAVSGKAKVAAPVTTGILLSSFMLSIAIDLNSKLEFLKYITPFKYYEAKNMMYGGGFDSVFVTLSAAVVVTLLSGTYVFYNKRDLNV